MDMFTIASHAATATAHYQEIYRQRFLALVAGWSGEGTTDYIEKASGQAKRLAEVNTEETYHGKLPGRLSLKINGDNIHIHDGSPDLNSNIILRVAINGQTPDVPSIIEEMDKERKLVNPELEA